MNNALQNPTETARGAQVWPLSVAAYHALGEAGLIPENTELLYGTVYRKMSKSPFHSALLRRLKNLLSKALPTGFFVDSEQPITCLDSEPEPDIAVIRGREEDFWEQHPQTAELVIEICVTTHEYDRSRLRAYSVAGVKECWLVLGPEKQVEVYRRPANGDFSDRAVYRIGAVVDSNSVAGLSISVDAIFTK